MGRLTNKQMELLSERVVDILETRHNELHEDATKSESYVKFEEQFYDDVTSNAREQKELQDNLEKQVEILNERIDKIKRDTHKLAVELNIRDENNYYKKMDVADFIKLYLAKRKKEQFDAKIFQRDKMLRKIQTDLLLSDTGNTEELINSLVAKY